jgi:hypothetical protein
MSNSNYKFCFYLGLTYMLLVNVNGDRRLVTIRCACSPRTEKDGYYRNPVTTLGYAESRASADKETGFLSILRCSSAER